MAGYDWREQLAKKQGQQQQQGQQQGSISSSSGLPATPQQQYGGFGAASGGFTPMDAPAGAPSLLPGISSGAMAMPPGFAMLTPAVILMQQQQLQFSLRMQRHLQQQRLQQHLHLHQQQMQLLLLLQRNVPAAPRQKRTAAAAQLS
jgi:hypothetical protein